MSQFELENNPNLFCYLDLLYLLLFTIIVPNVTIYFLLKYDVVRKFTKFSRPVSRNREIKVFRYIIMGKLLARY